MTVFVVGLESIETRYTCEWEHHIPKLLADSGFNVQVVEGIEVDSSASTGAFLNFTATNSFKSAQVDFMAKLFASGKVKNGDYFLFTDAWHPGVINLRYMASLAGIKIKVGGLWHAGGYDPHDFLGRACGNDQWLRSTEMAFYNAYDHNFFATLFHVSLFANRYFGRGESYRLLRSGKTVVTGWPMEYLVDKMAAVPKVEKTNTVIFPHRISVEKQLPIFKDLEKELPEYEFIVCQEQKLTKAQYHAQLAKSKVLWSASLQETLGISPYEGLLLGVSPLLPNRLSYDEMYMSPFKYPSEWTKDFNSYMANKEKVVNRLRNAIETYDDQKTIMKNQTDNLTKSFFSSDNMIRTIKGEIVYREAPETLDLFQV